MTDQPASPFQPIIDIAIDAISDLASGLADETGNATGGRTGKTDPLLRFVTGVASGKGDGIGSVTALFDQFVPQPPVARKPEGPSSTWSSATDDVRSLGHVPTPPPGVRTEPDTYPSTRAPQHASGVHVGRDATGGLKVVSLPNRCANVDCPNKDHEGHFVMVETEARVVSNGVRGIRLWMCHPCATGLISTMPDPKGA